MSSAKDFAERLREQAYKTLLPQIQDLEEEIHNITGSLSTGVQQIERKLEALRRIELPTTELVLDEFLGDVIRRGGEEKSDLSLFVGGLRKKETQEEILTFLLESARKYAPRVALFAIRGDRFVGWSSRGFSESLAKDIGAASLSFSECPQFLEASKNEGPTEISALPDREPLKALQQDSAGSWRLLPLQAMQRPVALLLAGETETEPCNTDALSVLVNFASLHLENIALKILNSFAAAPAERGQPPASSEAAAAAAAEFPSEEAPLQEEAPEEKPPDAEFVEEKTAAEKEPQEEAAAPALEREAPESKPQEEAPVAEEEKLHSDAKRFARLLVSEIKLYNEHHITEGRENRDLYLRLKRDIDRSREMYEQRVSPAVSRKIDYFHDEIVRILGDNDPSTLGSDYPGPRVES